MNTLSQTLTENGPVVVQDSSLENLVNIQHKDFLGRKLSIGDRVVIMHDLHRKFRLAQVVSFTDKKVKVKYGDRRWDTKTTESHRMIRVEGPDLTWYLISQS